MDLIVSLLWLPPLFFSVRTKRRQFQWHNIRVYGTSESMKKFLILGSVEIMCYRRCFDNYCLYSSYIRDLLKKLCDLICLKKYLFINIYFILFKVIPLKYNTLVLALFPIFKALLICLFRYSLELLQRCRLSPPQSWQTSVLSWVFLVLEIGKSRKGPGPLNTAAEAWLRYYF